MLRALCCAALALPASSFFAAAPAAVRARRGVVARATPPAGGGGAVPRRSALASAAVAAAAALLGPQTAAAEGAASVYDFEAAFNGKTYPMSKFEGKAMIVLNYKGDDPEGLKQMPAMKYLLEKYADAGLRVLAFPTDQGFYEANPVEILRGIAYSQFGFGRFPVSVLMDKVDLIGEFAHPMWRYLSVALPNPQGVKRVTVNFEKFLIGADGRPLRRYPKLYSGYSMEDDVVAALAGEPLPATTPEYDDKWALAKRELEVGQYAFKPNYNVYAQTASSTDWPGAGKFR